MNSVDSTAVSRFAYVWFENDVWNISAIDFPIVAYGEEIEEAHSNFEEAVNSHLEALAALKKI